MHALDWTDRSLSGALAERSETPVASRGGEDRRGKMLAMRWLRRLGIVLSLVAALAAAGVALLVVRLPDDARPGVLELRGRYGGAEPLVRRQDERSEAQLLALRNHRGEEVARAWVRTPRRPAPEPRALVTYTGARTGERILGLIPPADDLILVAVQYPFEPPHGVRAHLRAPYDIRRAAYRSLAGGLLAVDHLTAELGVAPERILLLGASLGSIFATLHGALDERVAEVLLVHGGAALPPVLERALARRVPAVLQPLALRIASVGTATFDPERYVARIAPRPLFMIAARDDRHFPSEAVEAFFARAREPKRLRWTATGHVGSRRTDVVDEVVQLILEHLEREASSSPPAAAAAESG
jgi:dienelactone hydrolase